MKFTFNWKLEDLKKVKKNGKKVFSCFACGGGSTMGYKMSGFTVLGCNEIDPEMIGVYKNNHDPKYAFLAPIQEFKLRTDLPEELFGIDILDGSPPCSNFSMAGSREKDWGKKKKFREGQADQILDDLFFDFIDLAEKLKPKVVVAENVAGMLRGNARGYVKEIIKRFSAIGYDVQLFLLNGASMGLPQARERVFFICRKKSLKWKPLVLNFNEPQVSVRQAFIDGDCLNDKGPDRAKSTTKKWWEKCAPGQAFSAVHPKGSLFNHAKLHPDLPCPTLTAAASGLLSRWDTFHGLTTKQFCLLGSFPLDYKFKSDNLASYQIGMSVPPLMMHKISEQISKQWFKG